MVQFLRRIADARWFQRAILAVIVGAGVLVGIETDPDLVARLGRWLHFLDGFVVWVFAAELAVKLGARGGRWWEYFLDPWNVFDFLIVVVCFLPLEARFAAVLRLVRVLRVLRLVTALPRLQVLVGALLKSIPSMGYVAVLLLLHFYIYAVLGVSLFGRTDATHFGSLGRAMLTLFQIVTLEGWADIMHTQLEAPGTTPAWPILYFVTFILLGTMIILNLLIGVIMNGMQEAQAETDRAARRREDLATPPPSLAEEWIQADRQLNELRRQLERLRQRTSGD